jgi:calcineurin-like phosphoesterase family protein
MSNHNIWFTSDTHWNHKNIVRGTTEWDVSKAAVGSSHQSVRDFDTLEEHNTTLIKNFNSVVKPEDTLWHLGDWSFGGHENIKKFRDQLNCRNIHLIFGNHDQHIEPINSVYRECFSSAQYVKEFSLKLGTDRTGRMGRQKFFLSHYSHQVWNQSHHGTIHLFGHSHGTLRGIGKSMDVGVDTHALYPYHLDEVLDVMKHIKIGYVDHHSQNTN